MYLLERVRLLIGSEGAGRGARGAEGREAHLRPITRDVDQVVAGRGVAVHVAGEHVAGVPVGEGGPERRDARRAPAEEALRVGGVDERAMPGELAE